MKDCKKEQSQEVCSAAAVQSSEEATGGVAPSTSPSSKLRDALLCQICYDQQLSMVFQSGEHREHVLRNWIENHVFIAKSNSLDRPFQLGHNQFSGMNHTEYIQWIHGGINSVINVLINFEN